MRLLLGKSETCWGKKNIPLWPLSLWLSLRLLWPWLPVHHELVVITATVAELCYNWVVSLTHCNTSSRSWSLVSLDHLPVSPVSSLSAWSDEYQSRQLPGPGQTSSKVACRKCCVHCHTVQNESLAFQIIWASAILVVYLNTKDTSSLAFQFNRYVVADSDTGKLPKI